MKSGDGEIHTASRFHQISDKKSEVLVFGEGVVRIAIQPTLAGLRRCNHRVPVRTRMFARVLLRRAVAAQRRTAALARTQMHPSSADLHTLSALTALSMLDRCNRGKMGAGFFRRHFTSLSKIHGRTEPTLHPQRSTLNRLHDWRKTASLKFTKTTAISCARRQRTR